MSAHISGPWTAPEEPVLTHSHRLSPPFLFTTYYCTFSVQTIELSCILSSQKAIITFARQTWSISNSNSRDGLINWHWCIKQLKPTLCWRKRLVCLILKTLHPHTVSDSDDYPLKVKAVRLISTAGNIMFIMHIMCLLFLFLYRQ